MKNTLLETYALLICFITFLPSEAKQIYKVLGIKTPVRTTDLNPQ